MTFMEYILKFFQDEFVSIIIAIGMLVVTIQPSHIEKKKKQIIRVFVIFNFLITILSYIDKQQSLLPHPTVFRMNMAIPCYILKPVLFLILMKIVVKNIRIYHLLWIPEIINAFVYGLAFFNDKLVFHFDANNQFVRGPLGFTIQIVSIFYLVVMLISSLRFFTHRRSDSVVILIFSVIVIMIAMIIDTFRDSYLLNPAISVTSTLYYIYLYMEYEQGVIKQQKEKLKEQRNSLMISQIQPHFIYNTLNIIYYLCQKDPKLAGETTVKFSDYLRANLLSSEDSDKLIPVSQEIEHTKNYTDIEMLRFNNIHIIYEEKSEDFKVPSLCIQPIVENAIRHGVRDKEDGLITVRTFEKASAYIIEIKDNGIGYVRKEGQLGKHLHIGIKNVKERIEELCHGSFEISMVKNVGTTVTMTIPKQ